MITAAEALDCPRCGRLHYGQPLTPCDACQNPHAELEESFELPTKLTERVLMSWHTICADDDQALEEAIYDFAETSIYDVRRWIARDMVARSKRVGKPVADIVRGYLGLIE